VRGDAFPASRGHRVSGGHRQCDGPTINRLQLRTGACRGRTRVLVQIHKVQRRSCRRHGPKAGCAFVCDQAGRCVCACVWVRMRVPMRRRDISLRRRASMREEWGWGEGQTCRGALARAPGTPRTTRPALPSPWLAPSRSGPSSGDVCVCQSDGGGGAICKKPRGDSQVLPELHKTLICLHLILLFYGQLSNPGAPQPTERRQQDNKNGRKPAHNRQPLVVDRRLDVGNCR